MAHDDQFTAKGPPFDGAGVPRAGFSTIKTDFDFVDGVNAQGERCGVYGESLSEFSDSRTSPEDRTGVCGVGLDYGVYGKGLTTAGVYGENGEAGTGVFGLGLASNTTAVAGISKVKTNPDQSGGGIGVVGATESGEGFGVVGLSLGEINLNPLPPTNVPRPVMENEGLPSLGTQPLNKGTGVLGMSGGGTGVFGYSENGKGVYGYSKNDRGGTFESNTLVAQVRLVPARQKSVTPELPRHGKVGDLLMIRNTTHIEDRFIDMCSLWLCVPQPGEDEKSDSSNRWQQIQLGSTVIGTL